MLIYLIEIIKRQQCLGEDDARSITLMHVQHKETDKLTGSIGHDRVNTIYSASQRLESLQKTNNG